MDFPPVRFGLLVEMEVTIIDIIEAGANTAYCRCTTTIWVEEGLDDLVPHYYMAWYIWFNGDLVGPFHGFNGPPRPSDASASGRIALNT
ncbi:hypothetical protein ACJRO7_016044 [Eucalyptus globulus]|uniref:Uncharacterized protein n=1 Tax=Eucalyptus globulus TaxID=34317 RepID=A0ABD3L648_EUCGL